jgi:hypothetical protein
VQTHGGEETRRGVADTKSRRKALLFVMLQLAQNLKKKVKEKELLIM